MMKVRCAVLAALLLAAPVSSARQSKVAPPVEECSSVTIPVSVVDNKYGRFVEGLTPTDFTARLGGKAAQVLSVNVDPGPHRVILLLDESASMAEPAKWRSAVSAASHVLGYLNTRDSVGLTVFAERPEELLPLGTGRARPLDVLAKGKIFPGWNQLGGRLTAIWDSILSVAGQFGSPQPGDAIFVVTDGGDTRSKHKAGQVATALLADDVRVFAFWVRTPFGRMAGGSSGQGGLDLVAKRSGGAVWPSPIGWVSSPRPFKSTVAQVDDFYEVDLSVPAAAAGMRSPKVKLGLAKKPGTRNLEIDYPRMLPACVAASR